MNKISNVFEMVDQNILPNITSQANWKYAKYPDKVQFTDGMTVHQFHLPTESLDGENIENATKHSEPSYADFGNDAAHTGTLQVHHSDPGKVYFTMHGGEHPITGEFEHHMGNAWKYIPKHHKKKEAAEFIDGLLNELGVPYIDKQAFCEGIEKVAGNDWANNLFNYGVIAPIKGVGHYLDTVGNASPLALAGTGLAAGAAYDWGKRKFYNTEQENENETTQDRLKRYILPTGALLGSHLIAGQFKQPGAAILKNPAFQPILPKEVTPNNTYSLPANNASTSYQQA